MYRISIRDPFDMALLSRTSFGRVNAKFLQFHKPTLIQFQRRNSLTPPGEFQKHRIRAAPLLIARFSRYVLTMAGKNSRRFALAAKLHYLSFAYYTE